MMISRLEHSLEVDGLRQQIRLLKNNANNLYEICLRYVPVEDMYDSYIEDEMKQYKELIEKLEKKG